MPKSKAAHTPQVDVVLEMAGRYLSDFQEDIESGLTDDKEQFAFDEKAYRDSEALIAAAPELLAALKAEHNPSDIPEHDRDTCKACAAISKCEVK